MKKTPTIDDLESFAVRHTRIIDRDKVRYRVYRTSTEYIAVIAENALMAMKLSGIEVPHKIIRDLIDENTPIAQARLREVEDSERVEFSISQKDENLESNFIYREPKEPEAFFQPMSLGQLNEEKAGGQDVVSGQEIMKDIKIDPMEYARATRTDDAERMHAESEQPLDAPVAEAPPEPQLEALPNTAEAAIEEPNDVTDTPSGTPEPLAEAVPVEEVQEVEADTAPEAVVETAPAEQPPAEAEAAASEEEGELPADEIARLLAEPRD